MRAENYYKENSHAYMDLKDDLFAEYILEQIESNSPGLKPYSSKALELGSGMGRFSSELVNRFMEVDLVEPSVDFYHRLKEKFGGEACAVCVYNQTASEYFKEVKCVEDTTGFTFHLLHHMSKVDRIELFSFMKVNNIRAVFVEPNPYNFLILVQILLHPDMKFKEEKSYLALTYSGMGQELKAAGIKKIRHRRICFFPPFVCDFLLRRKLNHLVKFFDKFCQFLPFMPSYQLFFYDPDAC